MTRILDVFGVRCPDSHSFLLDPSFLNSFLPLEKKPFFFLPCAEQSVCVRLAAGRGAGGEQQASAAAGAGPEAGSGAGPGPGSRSDVGLAVGASLGRRSVTSIGSGRGSVWRCKASSNVEGPGC